jgi:hypothetical protein
MDCLKKKKIFAVFVSLFIRWFFFSFFSTLVVSHNSSYHMTSFEAQLVEMGVVCPLDLLDVTPSETVAFNMRSLELRRWERMIGYLRLSPPILPCRAVLPLSKEVDAVASDMTTPALETTAPSPPSNDIGNIKNVVWKTVDFKHIMETQLWDVELLEYILNEISRFVASQSIQYRNHVVDLFAGVLDGLDSEARMEALLAEMLR